MRDLPLNALRALAAVHAHGGVRAAARELGVAHSSISRHLAELERWVGAPLAEGGSRAGLRFTREGAALAAAAHAALSDIEQTARSLREARSERSVLISTAPSFAARWLVPRLPALEAAHPRLEISVGIEQRLLDPDGRRADIAIRMGRGPWPNVRCEPLMNELLYPLMSPAFWKRSGRPRRPADLAGLRLLHDRDPQASWEIWRAAHGPRTLEVRKGPRFTSSDLVLRAARQGQGVALARHRLASEEIASGALVRPRGALAVEIESAYWLVLPDRPRLRPAVAAVVQWLHQQAGADQPQLG